MVLVHLLVILLQLFMFSGEVMGWAKAKLKLRSNQDFCSKPWLEPSQTKARPKPRGLAQAWKKWSQAQGKPGQSHGFRPSQGQHITTLNPNSSHHPSRLIAQFLPHGIPLDNRPDPCSFTTQINTALANNRTSKHLKVVAASFNNHGEMLGLG